MNTADLTNPIFTDEAAAREYLEAQRWPVEVSCPHCGSVEGITKMQGKSHRPGLFLCGSCRGNFSVTVGTVYERSHIPLNKWLLATHLMSASKKGISAHQLHRMLGITYKSAWFMAHRIREAMKADGNDPIGGEGVTVEADETYIGAKAGRKKGRKPVDKHIVMSLVERGGKVRSTRVANTRTAAVHEVLEQAATGTELMTDDARVYGDIPMLFAKHEKIAHAYGEYVKGNVHTNTVEGFFSILKRGLFGTYQNVSDAHLQRYLAEFDFRYSNRSKLGVSDKERTDKALKGIVGKRLTYRRTNATRATPSLG